MEQKHPTEISPKISQEQLQAIGAGLVAYVKPIAAEDASRMLGQPVSAGPEGVLFALFGANGEPISISQSREAAIGNAEEHELVAASLH